jgi:polyhydroxyalkanoate synthesis repressor PhaR
MSEPGPSSATPRHLDLRKYPNRRYYDSTHSRHLTLEEIRRLVRDGCDIKVTDSKSGADITAQVLTQIILELETPKLENFPVNMLVQMIRANERVVGDFIGKYFQQAFTAYLDYHTQVEEQFRKMQNLQGLNPFAAWSQSVLNPFAQGSAPAPEPRQKEGKSEADDTRAMVAELREQLAALKKELKRRGGTSKK